MLCPYIEAAARRLGLRTVPRCLTENGGNHGDEENDHDPTPRL